MTDPFPDSTLIKMAENALASTMLPPMPSPQLGAVRFVILAEVFPNEGNALVANATAMAATKPAEDWVLGAAAHLNEDLMRYIRNFHYDKTWHDLHRKENEQ